MALQFVTRQFADSAVTAAKIDLSGTFDFSSGVVEVATPSSASHAATKAYVDNAAVGLYWKAPVRAATTANITLSGTQTIDGISLSAGQRVLVKDQTSAPENGIYTVASGSWSRAADMDAAGEFSGTAMFVQEGTTHADTAFVCTNDGDVVVDTTAIAFVQFAGNGTVQGGDGIAVTGNSVAVDLATNAGLEIAGAKLQAKIKANGGLLRDANGLSVSASNGVQVDGGGFVTLNLDGGTLAKSASGVKVADGGVGTTQLANDAVTADKIADSAVGTAALADAAVTLDKVGWTPEIYQTTGDSSTTAFTLSHQIPSAFYLMVNVYANGQHAKLVASSPADASEYAIDDTGSATRITFGAAPGTGEAIEVRYIH